MLQLQILVLGLVESVLYYNYNPVPNRPLNLVSIYRKIDDCSGSVYWVSCLNLGWRIIIVIILFHLEMEYSVSGGSCIGSRREPFHHVLKINFYYILSFTI